MTVNINQDRMGKILKYQNWFDIYAIRVDYK